MSRLPAASQPRALSLTEELEQLEQSITLTLQEIDHNFSKAHRIVTASILPTVEAYANHSREVWEGGKFWKQFFESSANVSLSGYEEQPTIVEQSNDTVTEDPSEVTHTTSEASESYETPQAQQYSDVSVEDIDPSDLSVSPSRSTPRPHKQKQVKRELSPYKALREDVHDKYSEASWDSAPDGPRTPRPQASIIDGIAITPEGFPEGKKQNPAVEKELGQKRTDPVLHTVLDKTYRIQATPISTSRYGQLRAKTPTSTVRRRYPAQQSAIDSSPLAPPQLHAEVFDSPFRRDLVAARSNVSDRVPGVSVLTPGRKEYTAVPTRTPGVWDSDGEDDSIDEATGMRYGQSPPKTMQFHVPQSRLVKTPAQEASKRMIGNILASAGVGVAQNGHDGLSDDFEIDLDVDDHYADDNSPSVVRKATNLDDEIF